MKKLFFGVALFAIQIAHAQQLNVTLNPTNVNCQGLKNGQVTANVTGGVPPYLYKWSNGETTQSISNLNSGYYKLYVEDQNGIISETEINLTEPEELRLIQFDASTFPNGKNTSCYNCNDGSINVNVAGGVAPYTFLWNDGNTQSNRNNLAPKDYQLTVSDAFGCKLRELNISIKSPEREDWTANGNATSNQNNFIGTTNNVDFVMKANNQEALRLKPNKDAIFSGNIGLGLGNSAPTSMLDVNGTVKLRAINSNNSSLPIPSGSQRIVTTDNQGNLRTFPLDIRASIDCSVPVIGWSKRPLQDGSSGSSVSDGNGGYITIYPQDNLHPDDIVKCPVLGNVGIGVLQPNYKVDVDGDVNVTGNFLKNGQPINESQWTTLAPIGTQTSSSISYKGHNVLIQKPDGTAELKLTADNNGTEIGSSNGNVVFYYNGSYNDILCKQVHSQRIKVCASGWCDYVFEKSYKLKPLLEVEKFISENSHLPDVPSAKEIESSEVDIFEIQKIQMKKIEELTLYMIQLSKENEELKKIILK